MNISEPAFFPLITVKEGGEWTEARAAVSIDGILKENLMSEDGDGYYSSTNPRPTEPKVLHQNRRSLVHALSAWGDNTSVEARLAFIPDLAFHTRGGIRMRLVIRVRESDAEAARRVAAQRYLSLVPLLTAYLPEAVFSPVCRPEPEPHFQNAVSIFREKAILSLSDPFKKIPLGYLPDADSARESIPIRHRFPWAPPLNDWSALASAIGSQLNPLVMVVRLQSCRWEAKERRSLLETVRRCDDFLGGRSIKGDLLGSHAEAIRQVALKSLVLLNEASFRIGVFLLSSAPIDPSLGNVVGAAVTRLRSGSQNQELFTGGFKQKSIPPADALAAFFFHDKGAFTADEAAGAFRLPSPSRREDAGFPTVRFRTAPAAAPMPPEEDRLTLFVNAHRGIRRPVLLSADDRMRHTFILGQTGTGKTTLMKGMIYQDILAGRGVGVIDPHGDMVDDLLMSIPEERLSDVILFDLFDHQWPIGFNILRWRTLEERDFIIDELFATIDQLYDMRHSGGPMFENNFRGMLKLLMGDRPRERFIPTLMEFIRCYLDAGFRNWLKKDVDDPATIDFVKELEKTRGEASLSNIAPYVTSKFTRFVGNNVVRRIICQDEMKLDFKKIMDEGKILMLKLAKGRLGDASSALIANQIVARFKYAALKRGEMAPENRRDFYLYVDEAHNLPRENFIELLSEARKYRLGLVLATQYATQMENPDMNPGGRKGGLLSALLGNVGTFAAFRLGIEDAAALERFFYPAFTTQDIISLPNWQGYARVQCAGESVTPFSFQTIRPELPQDLNRPEILQRMSRKRYGMSAQAADAQMRERRSR